MKLKYTVSVLFGFIIFVSVGLFAFSMKQNKDNLFMEYARTNLQSSTKTIAQEINTYLSDNLNAVNAISRIIANEDKNNWNKDMLANAFEIVTTDPYWRNINLCDINGTGFDLDGKEQKVDFCSYYQRALLGETIISITNFYQNEEEKSIVYTIPLYQGEKITGVLRASMDLDSISAFMTINTFRGKEKVYLLLQNGQIVKDISEENSSEIIFTLLDEDKTGYSELRQIMVQGKGIITEADSKEVKTLLSYTGLKNVSDGGVMITIGKNQLLNLYKQELDTEKNRNLVLALFVSALVSALILVYIALKETIKSDKIEGLAYYDEITGSINFNRFRIDAQELIGKSSDKGYAVVELAIDRFEYIKEFFGAKEGNRILKHISKIMAENVKADELFCRLNTDYFILLIKYHNKNELSDRISYINMKISNFKETSSTNEKYEMSLHYGIYCLDKKDEDLDIMISRANYALFMVKYDKNQVYEYYNGEMQNKISEEKEIEEHMFTALEEKEFLVYLQPKFDLKTGMQIGAEALVRWMHPDKGLMYPGRFIGVFEKNGFIVKLDLYILDVICHKLKVWIGKGYRPMPLSINISRLNLFDPNFIDNIEATLEKYGIAANLIILEMSEEVVSDNIEILSVLMTQLKDYGFQISIDNFGTGTTSMNTLYHVPVDELKLDRKFLLDIEKTDRGINIIHSIIETAKRLDIKVVSEGVENKIQAKMLMELGCNMIQGFVFSDPLPLREYEDYAYGPRAKENRI